MVATKTTWELNALTASRQSELRELFYRTFSDADGEEEGKLIAKLSNDLCTSIDDSEIFCFGAIQNSTIIASIFFTRLVVRTQIELFMLAPVAVSTKHQRQGVGQALIRFGLEALTQQGVDIVVTYGDPKYYAKLGFLPQPEQKIKAPLPLSMPFGWQGQCLSGATFPSITERPRCHEAFNNPLMW